MPVDLTPDGRWNALNAALAAATEERDALLAQAQAQDVEKLYQELYEKDEEVMGLRQQNQTILDQVGPLQAENYRLRATLEEIVQKQGRGGLKLAQAALDN